MTAIHKYSSGIPRVVNLLCEHCLVSAFVDQKKTIGVDIVDAVAQDFDLNAETSAVPVSTNPPTPNSGVDKFDLAEALRSLATIAERLKDSKDEFPGERKS